MTKSNWPSVLLRKLIDNPDMIKVYFIPGLLLFFDLVVRSVLGIDLTDVGADMAFLAVATYISLLIEDTNPRQTTSAIKLIFIIISMAMWIISLNIVSKEDPISLLWIDFRPAISVIIGLGSFIFSGIMTRQIILNESNQAQ